MVRKLLWALIASLLLIGSALAGSGVQQSASPAQGNGYFLRWTASQTGPYTQAPGVTNYAIMSPSGATPTAADLPSHRYHHHTQVAWNDAGTRLWVASSSGLNNEDASGQMTVLFTRTDVDPTWSAPIQALPPQSTMSDEIGNPANRVGWSRKFVKSGGNLYYVSAVQSGSTAAAQALVAVQCVDDGSVGSPFLIYNLSYVAIAPAATISYDATLGPLLFSDANVFGVWGGSIPTIPNSPWVGWLGQDGYDYTEPATFQRDANGKYLIRLWRAATGTTTKIWSSLLNANGTPIGGLSLTNIPNAPSQVAALRLTDGRIAVVLNNEGNRANIVLGLFNGVTGDQISTYYIRQNIPTTPTYPGIGKSGGGAYFGLFQNGNTLWVSYSTQKESVAASSVDMTQLNFVLKRDINPASNDNNPIFLERAA